jgi:hypothetical protein
MLILLIRSRNLVLCRRSGLPVVEVGEEGYSVAGSGRVTESTSVDRRCPPPPSGLTKAARFLTAGVAPQNSI